MGHKRIKTEHTGAKNGGGYWGKRADAKERCSSLRRLNSRREVLEALRDIMGWEALDHQIMMEKEIQEAWGCYKFGPCEHCLASGEQDDDAA